MENHTRRILIADNQYLIIEALKHLVESKLGYCVIEIVYTKSDLIRALSGLSIDLLIMDFGNLDFDDFSELKKIVCIDSHTPVLILCNSLTKSELAELSSIGIKNILYKSADKDEIITAIEATCKGKKYFSAEILDMLTETYELRSTFIENIQLTRSEIEIVKLIAEGYTTKEIATRKFNSYHTVMTHRKNIFRKLKINNVSELVMYAIRTGLIDNIEYHI